MPLSSPYLEDMRARASDAHRLFHVQFELTHRCNQRCSHCYLRSVIPGADPAGEMSLKEVTGVLDQLAGMQVMFITLTGGEIFTRQDAEQILRAAAERGFVFTLMTNGSMIKPAEARMLRQFRPLEVHVSLLGLAATHDRITGVPGSFNMSVRAMDLLREQGVRVRAKLIVTRPVVGELAALETLARAHADALVRSIDLVPGIDGELPGSDMVLDADNLSRLRFMDSAWLEDDCGASAGADADVSARPPESHLCNAGRSLAAIDPAGNVFPCISFRLPMGNVRDNPLAQIWNSDTMLEVARLTRRDLVDCNGCELRRFCVYCPGRAWLASGDWRKPSRDLCERAGLMMNDAQ